MLRDLPALDAMLRRIREGAEKPIEKYLDLGCGLGGVALYVSHRLGVPPAGVESRPEIAERARARGVQVETLDLRRERTPFLNASFHLVTCFGVLEHMELYDTLIQEARRLLAPGGHFLLSMPNLASYVNRLALLLGYQPQDVEVSAKVAAGVLPFYRSHGWTKGEPLGREVLSDAHLHSATLRCMRELLAAQGFTFLAARGVSPGSWSLYAALGDVLFGRFPSLSRRFLILAQTD
jgi:SAM-dependent methyltransferase